MKRFANRTVLVTGGNSGIGLAAAQAFAEEGARVVITGRDERTLETARASLGENAIAIRNEAGTRDSAQALARQLQDAGVTLDAAFFNAGVALFSPLEGVDETMWERSFDANVKGPYFQIQALMPLLNRDASLVLNGSINAHIGMPNSSVYAASKAALVTFAKTLSAELLPRGVRVNVVSPGPVTTPLHDKLGLSTQAATQMQAQIPLGRFGLPAEIASTVLHLASRESAFIVGAEIIVDGGMSTL